MRRFTVMTTNLIDLIGTAISQTDGSRKLTIKGETNNYTVYKIPLEYLYYNNQNGRISTWISQYTTEHGDLNPEDDKAAYNDILHEFIKKSNPQALKNTKNNIESFGQRVAGVVLQNGRIIDGNRRFTCWRELAKEGKECYFEAVILDESTGLLPKDIKRLELNLQHAEEKPVDYNPIDNLVDIYRDIVINKDFTTAEYATNIGSTTTKVEKMLEKSKLMVDFLEFINAEGKYYIARDLNLDGPLQEIAGILRGISNNEDKDSIKHSLFTTLLMRPNDSTRKIRDIGKEIIKSPNVNEYVEEYEETVEEVYNILNEEEAVDNKILSEKITSNDELQSSSNDITERYIDKNRLTKARKKPIMSLNTAFDTMDSIDNEAVSRMPKEDKEKFKATLRKIQSTITMLESSVD